MSTPTPRTDRQVVVLLGKTWIASYYEMHEHACTLERELAAEKARAERAEAELAPFKDTSKGIGGYIDSLMSAKLDAEAELATELTHRVELTTFVKRMVVAIRKGNRNDSLSYLVMDYLVRNKLDGEPMRADAEEVVPADFARTLERDLATERARLDSGQILLTVSGERVWHSGVDLRAAIDAAMKEDAT